MPDLPIRIKPKRAARFAAWAPSLGLFLAYYFHKPFAPVLRPAAEWLLRMSQARGVRTKPFD